MEKIINQSNLNDCDKKWLVKKYSIVYCITSLIYPFFWYYTGVYEAIPINILFGVLLFITFLSEYYSWLTTNQNAVLIFHQSSPRCFVFSSSINASLTSRS